MKRMNTNNIYEIDAAGKTLGRVATEAAVHLRGKNLPGFERNVFPKLKVRILNAGKIRISAKKMRDKMKPRYTGYPGGLKFQSVSELIAKKGYKGLFQKAVHGMLPVNKLRPLAMKNLEIVE